MKTVLIALLIAVVGISQCINRTDKAQPFFIGRYQLAGYDHSGQLVFTGTISLMSVEQDFIKGFCKIERKPNAPEGLFDQDGSCDGLMNGKKISLDLAPFLDDAGLLLEGQFDGGAINGDWRLDGFVTSEPLGTFVALKRFDSSFR